MSAGPSVPAEIKPLNDKINILATWNDPATKFKRNSEPLKTTASKLPTYEPCPEHKSFNLSQISGTNVVLDEADRTYNGSSAPGNNATTAPPPSTVPGANNTQVAGDPVSNDSFSKDLNLAALKCQLILHEGVEYKIYVDTMNLLHGGIGHLLRDNEIPQFPIGTPISQDQVDQWYTEDSASAIKIAQVLMGDVWSSLSDIRKRAVCDLAFNLGQPRLSKFVNFIKAMKAKDFNVAAVELKNSVWYAQVGRRRGNNIATMIAQGVDPTCCNLKYPG
jgi:lysozyme